MKRENFPSQHQSERKRIKNFPTNTKVKEEVEK